MRIINRFIILLFLLFNFVTISSQGVGTFIISDSTTIYPILDKWNFKMEDDDYHLMGDINYSEWYSISPIGHWAIAIPEAADHYDISWFQLPIEFTDSLSSDVGLSIPLAFSKYSLYFNETLLLKSDSVFGSAPRVIKIDRDLIKDGQNIISVKMDAFSGWGGFTAKFIEIGNYEILRNNWITYVIKNASISFVSLFLAIYFFIMYIYRRKERYNIYFAGFSLAVSLFILGYYGISFYIINQAWAYWLLTFVAGINMYMLPILFIHSFYHRKLQIGGKIFVGFYLLLTLFVIIEYLFTGQIFYFNKYLYMGFNLSYILVVFYLIFISIKAVIRKYHYSKTMLIGIILLTITFVYSMLSFSLIIVKLPLIGEGFFLMVIAFAMILAKRFAHTHSELEREYALNVELTENLEVKVEERTKELAAKNREIIESIEYAALIQNSILPAEGQMEEIFKDYYVYWKSKDIVGGDFYWVLEKENGFIAAIIDCTGHGVPGALLTMTAKSLLERISTHIDSDDPGLIITQLNKLLKKVLSQDNPYEIKDDGLEIGMCIYDNKEKTMSFAGSRMRLFTRCNDTITEYRGDKQGVGYKRSRYSYNYTTKSVAIAPGMSFHLTTDGYPEQSGGDKGYSFGWKKYMATILEMDNNSSMQSQKEGLEKALIDFQGEYSQRDDITLFGFKLKD